MKDYEKKQITDEYINKTQLLSNMRDTDMLGKEEIVKLPSEDVALVIHGKWINAHPSGTVALAYNCNRCCRRVEVAWYQSPEKVYPYCHCGAKMGI